MKTHWMWSLAVMVFSQFASAGFFDDLLNSGCNWNPKDPVDMAISQHERLITPAPQGLYRKIVPFRESDFQTKAWMREYEYVIVINSQSPYKHHTELPSRVPMFSENVGFFGIKDVTKSDQTLKYLNRNWSHVNEFSDEQNAENAKAFLMEYGAEADKVRRFGEVIYKNAKPVLDPQSVEPQTLRIYQRGQLIRKTKISTGRGSFQLRGRKAHCEMPLESYHTYTEPGYYNFQELLKEYKSKSYDALMPNAMFYNRGRGLALHQALDVKIPFLGTRHSGGCTRMDPDTAFDLFERISNTKGARIPVLDVFGNPVLDANGQMAYKTQETVIFGEGTPQELRSQRDSYSALLVIQEGPVEDSNPQMDQAVTFQYRK